MRSVLGIFRRAHHAMLHKLVCGQKKSARIDVNQISRAALAAAICEHRRASTAAAAKGKSNATGHKFQPPGKLRIRHLCQKHYTLVIFLRSKPLHFSGVSSSLQSTLYLIICETLSFLHDLTLFICRTVLINNLCMNKKFSL